jgi:hypothetical protein
MLSYIFQCVYIEVCPYILTGCYLNVVCVCVRACALYAFHVYKDKSVIGRGLMFIRAKAYKHKQNTNTNVAKLIKSRS